MYSNMKLKLYLNLIFSIFMIPLILDISHTVLAFTILKIECPEVFSKLGTFRISEDPLENI